MPPPPQYAPPPAAASARPADVDTEAETTVGPAPHVPMPEVAGAEAHAVTLSSPPDLRAGTSAGAHGAPDTPSDNAEPGIGVDDRADVAADVPSLERNLADGLRLPNPAALERAKPMFERWLQESRTGGVAAPSVSPPAAAPAPTPARDSASGVSSVLRSARVSVAVSEAAARRYPIASALLTAMLGTAGASAAASTQHPAQMKRPAHGAEPNLDPEPGLDLTPAVDVPAAASPAAPALAARPPAGAPTVRPGTVAPAQAAAVSQTLLQDTAQAALLWSDAPGSSSFRVDFHDALIADAACIVTVGATGVVATFYVADVDTRRLLSGEAERLRAQLTDRGLKGAAVRVVLGEPPGPFAPAPDLSGR